MRIPIIGLALVLLAAGSSVARAEDTAKATSQAPVFAGTWTLDRDLSDLPPDEGPMMNRERMGRGGRRPEGPGMVGGMGRPMGGFGGMGRPMGGGFGDARPSREEMEATRAVMRSTMKPPEEIAITQNEQELVIESQDGTKTTLAFDGHKVKSIDGVERRARFKKNELEEEIEVGLVKIKRIYSLSETDIGRRLLIAVRIDNKRFEEPREFSIVYAPAVDADADVAPTAPKSTPNGGDRAIEAP